MGNASDVEALARALVLGPTAEGVLALADAVLDDERVRLALMVREGGPHAVRRAIELAALVLARTPRHDGVTLEESARNRPRPG